MNIDQYINWGEIWSKEVSPEASLSCLEEKDSKTIEVIKQFLGDKEVYLLPNACFMNETNLVFTFGETGGQNEGDTQGWSRDYSFTVDKDFLIIKADYEQG